MDSKDKEADVWIDGRQKAEIPMAKNYPKKLQFQQQHPSSLQVMHKLLYCSLE